MSCEGRDQVCLTYHGVSGTADPVRKVLHGDQVSRELMSVLGGISVLRDTNFADSPPLPNNVCVPNRAEHPKVHLM